LLGIGGGLLVYPLEVLYSPSLTASSIEIWPKLYALLTVAVAAVIGAAGHRWYLRRKRRSILAFVYGHYRAIVTRVDSFLESQERELGIIGPTDRDNSDRRTNTPFVLNAFMLGAGLPDERTSLEQLVTRHSTLSELMVVKELITITFIEMTRVKEILADSRVQSPDAISRSREIAGTIRTLYIVRFREILNIIHAQAKIPLENT